jgi:RNA polymerase sigma factor (sigma-70 family)
MFRCTSTIAQDRPSSPPSLDLAASGSEPRALARADSGEPGPATLRSGLLLQALGGEPRAERRLVEELTPTIRASVARELFLRRRRSHGSHEQDVEDITQTVLLRLFTDGGRTLKAWNPARGRELKSFVALLAQRRTLTVLRSRRQSRWGEDPVVTEDLDMNPAEANGPESCAISRDMLAALFAAVRGRLSPRGATLFQLLFVEALETEEVCAETGLNPAAVYQWRRRLRQTVEEVAAELGHNVPPPSAP